jgi:ribonuclease Y
MSIYVVLLVVVTAILTGVIVFALSRYAYQRSRGTERDEAEIRANQRLAEVESSAKERLLEAKEEAVKIRAAAEQEARETRAQAQVYERRLHQKEENLERRVGELERREQGIGDRERSLEEMRAELEETTKQQLREFSWDRWSRTCAGRSPGACARRSSPPATRARSEAEP